MDFSEIAYTLKDVSSEDQLRSELEKIIAKLNIQYYLFCLFHPTSFQRDSFTLIDNYPKSWMQFYQESNLSELDPLVHHCRSNILPLVWQDIYSRKDTSMQGINVLKEAALIGLNDGISLPIHGVGGENGVFSISDSVPFSCKRVLELTCIMQNIAPLIHETVRRLRSAQEQDISALTKREIECLTWASAGKTAWEISKILGISERTANFHLINTTQKVKAVNRQHAIAKALMQGIILP